jgi:hypothetical protein
MALLMPEAAPEALGAPKDAADKLLQVTELLQEDKPLRG